MRIRTFKVICTESPSLAGTKIAVAADLHSRDGSGAAEQIIALRPDIICAPGDILHSTNKYSIRECFNTNGFEFLKKCRTAAPVFYSLGNHERGMTEENRAILADADITLLDNTWVRHGGLLIGGLTSGYTAEIQKQSVTPPPDVSFLHRFAAEDGYRLLLCHHPEYWPAYIRETDIELTLSGHAHGGQWQIPLTGRGVYAPGQGLFPRYTGGVYENRLAVSRGMANTVSVPRFFNPREILMIELTTE